MGATLGEGQKIVLKALKTGPATSRDELFGRGVPSNVNPTRVLDTLERRGMVRFTNDMAGRGTKSGKGFRASLTSTGRSVARRLD
jgi:hypothetical protein